MNNTEEGIALLIRRLAATFGRLDKQSLELSEGLNILEAPNETGKSTWCALLTAMLYGVNSRERDRAGFLAEKTRYAPWSGAAMQGRLDCRTAEGDELTLLRDTRAARSPMGEFSALYAGTGDPVPGLTGLNCGETLLGIPREVFERSAFIRQAGLGITQDAELERRILALVTSGEEDTSYIEAATALKRQLNRRRHNRTGEIPALEEELAQLRRRQEGLLALNDELASTQERLAALTRREQELAARLALCDRFEAAQKHRELDGLRQAAETAERHADALRTELEAGHVPEMDVIGRLRGAIVNLETTRKGVERARDQRDDALKARLRAETAANEHPFAPLSAEEARRQADAPPASMSRPIRILPLIYVAYGLVFFWLNRSFFHLPYWAQVLAGVIPAAAVLCLYRAAAQKCRRENAARLKRWGAASFDALPGLADAYCALLDAQTAAEADAAAKSGAYDTLYGSLSSNEQGILLEVRRFAPAAFDISAADAALRDGAVRRRQAAEAEAAAREARLRYETLAQQAGDVPEAGDLPAYPVPDRQETSAALAQVRASLAETRSGADRLAGQLAAGGDSAVLEAQCGELQSRLTALEGEYDALTLALETLEQANTELQNRFSPALGRRAAEIFSQLTEGRYSGVVLDRSFRLSAEPDGDHLYRDAQFLSAGTADQLYLAVRLAVCELVLPKDRQIPIILDDALTNFDDRRCAIALDWLLRESQSRQILLFTCHSREADYLRNTPGVNAHVR